MNLKTSSFKVTRKNCARSSDTPPGRLLNNKINWKPCQCYRKALFTNRKKFLAVLNPLTPFTRSNDDPDLIQGIGPHARKTTPGHKPPQDTQRPKTPQITRKGRITDKEARHDPFPALPSFETSQPSPSRPHLRGIIIAFFNDLDNDIEVSATEEFVFAHLL